MKKNKEIKKRKKEIQRGIKLNWCAGFNYNIKDSVINLCTYEQKQIFYVSGHVGIIYDYENNKQRLFQGHSNQIQTVCYNEEKKIIITADKGESCMIIIWSQDKGTPLRTFFYPEEDGIKSMDITKKGDLLVTLSFTFEGKQHIKVWDWQDFSKENPIINEAFIEIDEFDDFNFIKWNYSDENEFVTTGAKLVRFWKREKESCISYSPFIVKKEEKKRELTREFTQTVFIPDNNGAQAITGTLDGNLIVWDVILILEELSNLNNRREIKSISLLNNNNKKYGDKIPGISLLEIYENMIVVGTTVGTVRFYDFRFRILCWFEDLKLDQINSISFCRFKNDLIPQNPLQDDLAEEDIDFPDFLVCDASASISMLSTNLFREIEPSKRTGQLILKSIQKKILWMTVDSTSQQVALSCSDGLILTWKFWQQTFDIIKNLKDDNHADEIGNCLEYSPNGEFLIVATNQGNIYIKKKQNNVFNAAPLLISHKKKGIKCKKLVFSNCSKYFAVSDDHKCISLFHLGHKYGDKSQPIEWVFKGKMRAHTLEITDLCFGQTYKNQSPRLYSISKDMYLVEYEILNDENHLEKELIIKSYDQIEANKEPTACIIYPEQFVNNESLLVANMDYKLKIWGYENNKKICRQTCLGPSYGGKIASFINLEDGNKNRANKYVAFKTDSKVLGIIKLPLTGNPNNSIGIISNPGEINHICASKNGKYILTAGNKDLSLNIWKIDYDGLDQNPLFNLNNENPLDIYPELLEGGEDGDLYRDLKDFFYYSQIRKEEENTTKAHKLDGKIPLKEIPNLMIALGHYPSTKEIENMKNEVKYSHLSSDGNVKNLSLKDFVKLFINHRSPYGLTSEYIQEILKPIFDENGQISREDFLNLLMNYGEQFNEQEINQYLNVLVGDGEASKILPSNLDFNYILGELFGFESQQIIGQINNESRRTLNNTGKLRVKTLIVQRQSSRIN